MAILTKGEQTRVQIDLTGPEGNAFVLMGYAKTYARHLDLDGEAIVKEMLEPGNYEELILVFDRHFGAFVDLLR